MRSSNLSTAASQLKDALDKLKLSWETTRETWADQKADQFEEEVLIPVFEEVMASLPAIDAMNNSVNSAIRALEE